MNIQHIKNQIRRYFINKIKYKITLVDIILYIIICFLLLNIAKQIYIIQKPHNDIQIYANEQNIKKIENEQKIITINTKTNKTEVKTDTNKHKTNTKQTQKPMLESTPKEKQLLDNKSFDVYTISGMSKELMSNKLKGTYLYDSADILYDIEQSYGVNFRAIYSIGALESGYGKYTANINNLFGIKDTKTNRYKAFKTKSESLYFLADILSSKFYKGRSLESINKDYCPNNLNWHKDVKSIMNTI